MELQVKQCSVCLHSRLDLAAATRLSAWVVALVQAAKVDVKTVIKSVREKHEKSERSIKEKLTKFKVSNDEIERSVSLLERYCIPLDNGARGLYPETMKLTHSCSPNTYFIGLSNGWCIYRAAVDINEGDLITTLHIPTCVDKCNYFRSKILQESGIKCSCDRCTDSTELGTGFGSLLCTNCQNFVAPEKPGEFSSAWKCVGCGSVEDGSKCTGILDRLNKQILDLPKAATQRDPIKLENIIREKPGDWSRVPDSHQLILDVRKQLAFTYQYHTDYYFPKCDFLNKKENHCKLWLEQMEILAPGWSYEKVLMKYELGSAMTSKIQAMKEGGFQSSEVNDQCYKATEMVEEPIKMMIEEEELSLCTALKQIKMIAIEAREEQKTRVYLNMWADDEEEDW